MKAKIKYVYAVLLHIRFYIGDYYFQNFSNPETYVSAYVKTYTVTHTHTHAHAHTCTHIRAHIHIDIDQSYDLKSVLL